MWTKIQTMVLYSTPRIQTTLRACATSRHSWWQKHRLRSCVIFSLWDITLDWGVCGLGISHILRLSSLNGIRTCVDRCVLYRRTRTIPDSNCDPHPLVSLSTRLASLTCALSLIHSLYSLLPCLSCFKLRFIHSTWIREICCMETQRVVLPVPNHPIR